MAAAVPVNRSRRPRGKRFQPARCINCRDPIVWFNYRGSWWKFEPHQVPIRTHSGPPAHPVEGKKAWTLHALVEELMGRREISQDEALEEAYDFPWYVVHTCRKAPTR